MDQFPGERRRAAIGVSWNAAPPAGRSALQTAYLFGAICLARGVGAARALPFADTEAMQLHIDEIGRHVAKGAHAVLLLDRAGWHTTARLDVSRNITPIFLPSRAPERNPVENVWQYLYANWPSNRVFDSCDAIIDAACEAWQKLIAQPQTIKSIGLASSRFSLASRSDTSGYFSKERVFSFPR